MLYTKKKHNYGKYVLFGDGATIKSTTCNQDWGIEKLKWNESAINGSKVETVQYAVIWMSKYFILSILLPINSHPILTNILPQRYIPQNADTLHYNSILLHKQQHKDISHNIPLPCTTPVYCYTHTNTTVSTTKCRYLALHQYTVTQTSTQRYLPQNAVTLH